MSEHLHKAKRAMAHARDLDEIYERDPDSGKFASRRIETGFNEAVSIARIHAEIAKAEALLRIAVAMEEANRPDVIEVPVGVGSSLACSTPSCLSAKACIEATTPKDPSGAA